MLLAGVGHEAFNKMSPAGVGHEAINKMSPAGVERPGQGDQVSDGTPLGPPCTA